MSSGPRLPAMAPALNSIASLTSPAMLVRCWRLGCFSVTSAKDDLGLCPDCVEELRSGDS